MAAVATGRVGRRAMAMLRAMAQSAMAGALNRVAAATHATALPPLFGAHAPFSLAARSMKVMQTLKKRCEHCVIVRRGQIRYVYCKMNPRHKARNGPKRRAGWLHKRNNS